MDRGIKLARDHHRTETLVARHLVDGNAGRRLEAGRAAVALFRRAFHPEFHVFGANAELMLQHATRPQRSGLLIFRNTNPLALEIGRLLDTRLPADQNRRVEKPPGRENRQSKKPRVALTGYDHE